MKILDNAVNTYDSATGLLTATDVTVNGTKQRVSAVAYDDLGRIASVTRGAAQLSGGTVSYTYNLHGQTKTITGPGFTQELFYTDGPGPKLYNGSVSSMKWKMLPDATVRGYKYSYNAYGWLTSAEYGEGDALTANKDRYTEKSTAFTRNGGITKLQRYGLTAGGTYGKIDDLTVSYSGNRINGVSDAAPAVTQNGSMDFPGGTTSKVFGYNSFGALASDAGRGITSISYDNFGNPLKVSFGNRGYTENVYSATGERLKTTHAVPVQGSVMARTTFHYRGDAVYRDGAVEMVRFPGGYATTSGGVKFHYYTQDYLGNNRAVISGSDGSVEQRVAYYPYGGVIANLGTPTTGQPYKFGGKELLVANGLNEYDFGARQYYSAVPGFTKPDPLCEDTYHLSPYLYCGNNPVNFVDRDGRKFLFSGGTESDYIQIQDWLNTISQGQYIFSYSYDTKTKTAEFTCTENEQFCGEISENKKNVSSTLKRYADADKAININIRNNDKNIIIGDVREGAIDMKDMDNLRNKKSVTPESAFLHELLEQSIIQIKGWENNNGRIAQAHEAASTMESMYMNVNVSPSREFLYKEGSFNIKDVYQLVIPYNPNGAFIDSYPVIEIIKIKNGAVVRK